MDGRKRQTSTTLDASPILMSESVADLIALGATLTTMFERLARREGNMTLLQMRTLDALRAVSPEPLEPGEIAQALQTGSNHVTMLLDQLESQRLISREPHPSDRRRRLVYITETGRQRAEILSTHMRALEERIVEAALTSDDQIELRRLAGRLQRVLEEIVVPIHRARPGP